VRGPIEGHPKRKRILGVLYRSLDAFLAIATGSVRDELQVGQGPVGNYSAPGQRGNRVAAGGARNTSRLLADVTDFPF